MLIKTWSSAALLLISAVLVTTSAFAGYDTRGMAPSRCSSAAYMDATHQECMRTCTKRFGSRWNDQDGYSRFRACYESCQQDLHRRCALDEGYPQQHFTPPTP